jgi:hypothetical protein
LSQETVASKEPIELALSQDSKASEKKKSPSIQELVESLKSVADDIGQISELSSEERILVSQFFVSFLKLMKPLTSSITVNQLALPSLLVDAVQAHVDPTGHLALIFSDGHLELKDLSEEKNRDLMISIMSDILPKFKNLTAYQKRKIENRIKILSNVTKEIQKSAEALSVSTV